MQALLLLALAGCAGVHEPDVLRVEGRLDVPAAAGIGAPSGWVVELRDDSANRVLTDQRGRVSATQSTIVFALTIARSDVDLAHVHSVRGALAEQGEVRWSSEARPVDLSLRLPIDAGRLRLAPYVSPGGFASSFDCAGRRVTIGYIGERVRLIDGARVYDLAVVADLPRRYALAGDQATFVQLDDAGATVSLQGHVLPRCEMVGPLR